MKVILDLMFNSSTVKTFNDYGDPVWLQGDFRVLASDPRITPWVEGNFAKVVVSVDSEAELLAIHEKAKAAGILTSLIKDAGLTEFGGVPTFTTVAVGPDLNETVDTITGGLKLL